MFLWWIKNDPSNCCNYIHVINGYYKRILVGACPSTTHSIQNNNNNPLSSNEKKCKSGIHHDLHNQN